MQVARKIAYNVVASSVLKMLSTVLALVAIGFITRYLGADGFGDYATVLAFLSFFSAISDLGLYSISTREISRTGADEERIMGNIFTLRAAISLLVFISSPLIVFFLPYTDQVKEGIVIVAAAYLFSSIYQVLNGVFQKNLAMDKVAISEFFGKLIQVAVIIVAVRMKLGFGWIVASLLFYMVVSFCLVYFWSKKYIRLRPAFDLAYWKKFLKESYPIGISAFVTFLYFKMDTIMLSIMKSSADVGIYNAAYKVLENITFFPAMIVGLIFPIMSQSILDDKKRFRNISDKTFKVFVLIVVPLVIGTLFLSDGVIALIGGEAFSKSAGVLRILVFALASIFFASFFNAILIAGNFQKKLMFILGFAAVFNLVLNYFVIPLFSYTGAAFVSVATEGLVLVAGAYLAFSQLHYVPRLARFWAIFLSGLAMGAFLFVFREQNFFLSGAGSVLAYILFLWIFRAVKTEEITSIISKRGVV